MSQYNKLTEDEINLWKQAINLALEKLAKEGWEERNNSTKFDVLYKGKRIPPKEVIAYVFEYFNANDITTSIYSVSGGDKHTNQLLRDFGLEVVEKKIRLKDLLKRIDVWYTWRDNYKMYVPNFIEESKKGLNYSEWDKVIFNEFFEKSYDQCVSSLKQGYFTHEEKNSLKKNWIELAPILKEISNSQAEPPFELFQELKQVIRKYTNQDRRAATHRLIASIQPNNLCTIVNHDNLNSLISYLNKFVLNADIKINSNWFENSYAVQNFFLKEGGFEDPYEMVTYPWQLFEFFNGKHHLNNNDMSDNNTNNEIIDLLKYKKQIILQGPPGTGKTRKAKLIAEKLIGAVGNLEEIPESIDSNIIKEYCIEGTEILSARDGIKYIIGKTTAIGVEVIATSGKPYVPKFTEIVESYQKKVWENEGNLKGGNDSYSAALAKFIYKIFEERYNSNLNEQFKLIQFHPSYTYEDFVRSIVAKPNLDGDGIVYEAEDKTLADFSKAALKNYNESKNTTVDKSIDSWIEDNFEDFKNEIESSITDKEYNLTGEITIYKVQKQSFLYGKSWSSNGHIKFDEFKKLIKAIIKQELYLGTSNLDKNKFVHSHYRSTYYNALLKKYFEKHNYQERTHIATLKNYVLIIDEINRANLSSVLGELIYALEYRGESVDSMYAVDGDNKLVLPPNLYIIGTMNTADRSVGHIDYAIRRRFAFVDVLPKDLSDEEGIAFDQSLFNQVAELFDKNLSPEFKKKDVQLGHSYFIDKSKLEDGVSMFMRLEYEIRPILLEYVKDGVLIGESIESRIENLVASI